MLGSTSYIFININTNKHSYFINTIKERTQSKITRCT